MRVKKSNIEIVKNYLAGERPFVSVGYTPPPIQRKEGEEWIDVSGQKWVQRHGYKTKVNEQANMIRESSKQKCACGQDINYGGRLDEKFFAKTGKCFNCIIEEETRLRVLGVYNHYEKYKLLSNYLGFLEDMKQKINDSIKCFSTESDTLSILCNGEGFLEKFRGMNTADLLIAAEKDLKEITEAIAKVTKDKAKAKKIYESELVKSKKRLIPKT
jgi:hypothetical protein